MAPALRLRHGSGKTLQVPLELWQAPAAQRSSAVFAGHPRPPGEPMKLIAPLALALAAGTLAAPAMAQFQKPEDAIKYRKAALTVMATHFGRVGAMANGRVPFDAK